MAGGADDVMPLLRLLLGAGGRIPPAAGAGERLRRSGGRGEGEGQRAGRPELLLPHPLRSPRAFRWDPGDHPALGQSRAAAVQRTGRGAQCRGGAQTPRLPTGHTGTGWLGRGAPARRLGCTHVPAQARSGRPGQPLPRRTLPPPAQTLPYLPEDWRSLSDLLPTTAPSAPLGSLWAGGRGWKSCGQRPGPEPPLLAVLGWGTGDSSQSRSTCEPPPPRALMGNLSGPPCKSSPPSSLPGGPGSPCTTPHPLASPLSPSLPMAPSASHGWTRLANRRRQSMAKVLSRKRVVHMAQLPHPLPDRVCRRKAKMALPALTSHCCPS